MKERAVFADGAPVTTLRIMRRRLKLAFSGARWKLPLWLQLWIGGTLGAPWSCMFCGSARPRAFLAWALSSGSRKLHPCKRRAGHD